ncbi:MAG: Pectinesterase, partial [Paenibacillaceae bacterium]|nr:Pectinesterase [Paenibacillaceae bacterium]
MYKRSKSLISKMLVLVILAASLFSPVSAGVLAAGETANSRKTDVWDFGGVEAAGSNYTNHITLGTLNGLTANVQSGWFKVNTTFDDLTVVTPGNYHRLYYSGTLSYGSPTTKTFPDGYTNTGSIYNAGTGDDTGKYIRIDNVQAGDIITLYGFSTNTSGSEKPLVNFALTSAGTGKTALKNSDIVLGNGDIFTFLAAETGSLKIYFTNTGSYKPNVARITRTPGVNVNGLLNLNGYALTGYELVFQNQQTAGIHSATLNQDSSFDVTLPAGYTYTAALLNVSSDYSISDLSKTVVTALTDIPAGIGGITLEVAKIPMAKVSGPLSGFDSGYDLSKLKVLLTPPADSLAPAVEAAVDKLAMTYSADVRSGIPYSLTISGVNDYDLTGGSQVQITADTTQDITVTKKPIHAATGTFVGLPASVTVSSIAFSHVEDGYVYPGTAQNGAYAASLRDGAYAVKAVTSDSSYTTVGHVVVNGSNAVKDIKFSTATPLPALTLVKDLYVGDTSKENNFSTVKQALESAARMNPQSEQERITIHIAPGVYRAQLKIETPYISLVNAAPQQGEVKITWYYGVGYVYYSANKGYYSEDHAFDKFLKGGVDKWGPTVYVTSKATGFRAENIVFENSFNKYITQEEIDDGVQVDPVSPTNTTERTMALDATSRGATERAAAIAIEADRAEFYKSKFLSNQDTLYTGAVRIYFKDSFIEGNTDYIFGDGNVVFDNCTLNFAGYSDQDSSGYITAASTDPSRSGYLFRDSTITGTSHGSFKAQGFFGRPWRTNAGAKFLDSKLQEPSVIVPQGWAGMSSNTPENARFYEYNTTYNGTPADTSARSRYVLSGEGAVTDVRPYFGSDWTPAYYTEGAVTAPVLNPAITTSQSQANLTWQPATTSIGSVIYAVYQDGQKIGTTTEAAYTVGSLAPATTYSFQVAAVNTAGNTATSSTVQATTDALQGIPAAPVITAAPGDSSATINWSTVTGATYYTVKGMKAGSTVYDLVYGISVPTVTSYTYANLMNGTAYQFVVTASNLYGESAASNTVTVTPSGQQGTLKFSPADFIGVDIDNPKIAGFSSFNDDTNIFTLTGSGTGINKAANGRDQIYMKAVKLKGDYSISAKATYSSGAFGHMALTIRESLDPSSYHYTQAATNTGGRKMFRYTGSSNGSNTTMLLNGTAYLKITKTGDKITSIISSAPIPENPVGSDTLSITTATAKDLGLDANGNPKELYAGLMVSSGNAANTMIADFQDVTIVMADGTVVFDSNAGKPIAPKNVASKPYDKSALISWDPLSTATSYTVKKSTSANGPFTDAQTVSGSVYQAMIDGLENGRTYYFAVTASNASGEGVASDVVSVIPSSASVMPPVITMTSAAPASQVFSALVPVNGSVDKDSTLTITNNGNIVKPDGINDSLILAPNGTFSTTLILTEGVNEIEIKAVDTYGNV